jgi:ABC-type sugar transport system substrate-binding protein
MSGNCKPVQHQDKGLWPPPFAFPILVHRLANNGDGVAFKMGRRQGARRGAYLNRYVTDEQRGRRPIFNATLRAGASWLFFRVARSTRMIQIWALRSRLEKQPTDLRRHHHYLRDGALPLFTGLLLALIPASSASGQSTRPYKIGALTKSLANPYFLLMKQGYEYAQKKLGVEVVFGSTPAEEADLEQLNILHRWLAEGSLEGYVVTPFRATSLNSALTRASRNNLPIINIDELIPEDVAKADGIKIVARIASNNVEAGKLDAQLVLSSTPKGSDVAIIEGDPGTTSSTERVTGFTNAAKEGGLNIVASQPANWNRKKAGELATNILEGDPNLKAIFAANDDMALGVVHAVQARGATAKIIIVSVDGTPDAIDALKQGLLSGTVAQYPDAMAYMAVETLVKKLKGETVSEKIDSPIKLITKDNVSDAGAYYKEELDLSSAHR